MKYDSFFGSLTDREMKWRVVKLVFRAEDPITCATIIIVFLAYYNEVHFIVAQLVNKSIDL